MKLQSGKLSGGEGAPAEPYSRRVEIVTSEERGRVAEEADSMSEADISARLVGDIRAGDRRAEQAMAERYGRGLLYLLRRQCGDPDLALDLRQDTLRIAIEKLRAEALTDPTKLSAFLRAIAMNILTAHRRKDTRRATYTNSDTIDVTADDRRGPYDNVSSQQVQAAVRSLLEELKTPRDREILRRVYLEEDDKDDICADFGIDSAHFSRVLFRAKQRFRELLTQAERRGRLRSVT
jgi:RNA polymerase sigma-70 factor (ECF subfamily)